MSPYKRFRFSTHRCVWFSSIAALMRWKAQTPLSDYYPWKLQQTWRWNTTHTHTRRTNRLDWYIYRRWIKRKKKTCIGSLPLVKGGKNGFVGDLLHMHEKVKTDTSIMYLNLKKNWALTILRHFTKNLTFFWLSALFKWKLEICMTSLSIFKSLNRDAS